MLSRKALMIVALVFAPVAFMVTMITVESGGVNDNNFNFVLAFSIAASITALASVGLLALWLHSSRPGRDEQLGLEQDSDEP